MARAVRKGRRKTEKNGKKLKATLPPEVTWVPAPAEHDYPSAQSYLRLLAGPDLVSVCVGLLSQAETVQQHAKDILRAARLPLLGADNPEVARDLAKIAAGKPLSPILLIRGDLATGRPLQIADGYHRVCATYQINENTDIPCRLVSLPAIAV